MQATESATVFQPPKQTNSLSLADAGTQPEQMTIVTQSDPLWIDHLCNLNFNGAMYDMDVVDNQKSAQSTRVKPAT